MTPIQCRMARAALGWTIGDLSKNSNVSISTVSRFETDQNAPIPANLSAMRATLEAAGLEFIAENGGGPGVRLRKNDT